MTETIQRAARAMIRKAAESEWGYVGDDGEGHAADIEDVVVDGPVDFAALATACIEALLDPSEEVVEAAAQASYERYQFLCGPAFRTWDEIPPTSREIYIEAQRAALRVYHMKVLGR